MSEHLRAADYLIRDVEQRVARELVARWHYAGGGPNTGVFRHGLFKAGCDEPLGVAWWLPPMKTTATTVLHDDWQRVLNLTRLVVAPWLPTNAASYLLGRSMRLIKQDGRWAALVTYADGRRHTGTIYRATNWTYVGAKLGDMVYLDVNGNQVTRKTGKRSRTDAEMHALGCISVGRSVKHKFQYIF